MDLAYLGTLILLILGFGFVVFWHELGHFLAAKWASGKEYDQICRSPSTGITPRDPSEIGETEYRLNWLPLGGYVKMLGQDDLNPNASVDDPRAYNNKPIGHRMIIVSAGVVMNVILAAILFMALFLIGFRAPPALVGSIRTNSPAQETVRPDGAPAPLQVGDRILYFDDKYQHDFTKITLAVALAGEGKSDMYVRRRDGTEEHLLVAPRHEMAGGAGFLMLGIGPAPELKAIPSKGLTDDAKALLENDALHLDEVIVAVQSEPVVVGQKDRYDYWKLDRALQQSFGRPVEITVRTPAGSEEKRFVQPRFEDTFGAGAGSPMSIAGMIPRAAVGVLTPNSVVKDKLRPGDVIVEVV